MLHFNNAGSALPPDVVVETQIDYLRLEAEIGGYEAGGVLRQLDSESINVTVTRMLSTRLDMESRGLTNMVRASVHDYNSQDEVDRFSETVRRLTGR